MKKLFKFSVIIPCYSNPNLLPNAMRSVAYQSFEDWECIVVSDGGGLLVYENFNITKSSMPKNLASKFILVDSSNSGLAAARNLGINLARGDYIAPLDDDDVFLENHLQDTYLRIASYPDHQIFPTLINTKWYNSHPDTLWPKNSSPDKLPYRNQLPYCSIFTKRVWEKVDGYDTSLYTYEDWEFFINCYSSGVKFSQLPEIPTVNYFLKPNGMFMKNKTKDWLARAKIVLKHSNFYDSETLDFAKTIANKNNILLPPTDSIPKFFQI